MQAVFATRFMKLETSDQSTLRRERKKQRSKSYEFVITLVKRTPQKRTVCDNTNLVGFEKIEARILGCDLQACFSSSTES